MDKSGSIEEEVTRSNFNSLLSHKLDIHVSKNLFKSKISDITSVKQTGTANSPFLSPKSQKNSVFDRLITDSNRRTTTALKLKHFKILREQEYENSFLSPLRISKESESNLVIRLLSDSERRIKEKNLREKQHSGEKHTKSYSKQYAAKVNEVVGRLFVDKRKDIEKRESLKKSFVDQEIASLKIIRQKRHPSRKVDQEALLKLSQRSPRCRHFENNEFDVRKSWKDARKAVDKLFNKGNLRISIPSFGNETKVSRAKTAKAAEGVLKLEDLDKNDCLTSHKATSKLSSSIYKEN